MINTTDIKNIAWLSSVSILAQLIPFVLLPTYASLYSEVDFANYGLCMAIANPLSVILALRIEQAIIPTTDQNTAQKLFILCFIFIVCNCIISEIVAITSSAWLIDSFSWSSNFFPYLLLIPVSASTLALATLIQNWWVRHGSFTSINAYKIFQAVLYILLVLSLGYASVSIGLIISDIFSRILILVIFFILIFYKLKIVPIKELKQTWQQHIKYPKYNLIPSLLDNMSLYLIVWIVAFQFQDKVEGNYNLARMAILSPIAALSSAMAQVYLRKYVTFISEKKPLYSIIKNQFLFNGLISLIAIIGFLIAGQWIFLSFFGDKWLLASQYAIYILLSTCIKFCISPFSSIFIALKSLRWLSFWQILSFSIYLLFFFFTFQNENQLFISFIICDVFLYLLYGYLIWKTVNKYDNQLLQNIE